MEKLNQDTPNKDMMDFSFDDIDFNPGGYVVIRFQKTIHFGEEI